MCATLSRNVCQNRGPKAPCGLPSNPRSLGDERPSRLSVADSSAGTSVGETSVPFSAIGIIIPRQRGAIEGVYGPDRGSQFAACQPEQRQPEARSPRISLRASWSRVCHAQPSIDHSYQGEFLPRALQVKLTLEINSL